MKIKLHMRGVTYVEVDPDDYDYARAAHRAGETGAMDRLLRGAIKGMDTEVIVTEPDGTSYDL